MVIDDAIAIRDMMYMSISFDHRIIDGLSASQFMGAIKRRLENWGPISRSIRPSPAATFSLENIQSPSAHYRRAFAVAENSSAG